MDFLLHIFIEYQINKPTGYNYPVQASIKQPKLVQATIVPLPLAFIHLFTASFCLTSRETGVNRSMFRIS